MDKYRIYEEKHNINTKNTLDFYNKRARTIKEMDNPYVAVLLGDQNPEHAVDWNNFEKKYILPDLNISKKCRVLDIGCGLGRWSESIIPAAGYYFGVDFSEEMVKLARERCIFEGADYNFMKFSFNELAEKEEGFFGKKFNRVIIGSVCMYINDEDLSKCYKGLLKHLDSNCMIYLTETVAVEKRLTLDNCPSDALKSAYDAIYRTPTEYNAFYKILTQNGFRIKKQDFLPHFNNEKAFYETDRWYTIFER